MTVTLRADTRRVENDAGEVRCNWCEQFKPVSDMHWKRGRPYCDTQCKSCHNVQHSQYGRSAMAATRRRQMQRAEARAATILQNRYRAEYAAIVKAEFDAIRAEQIIGYKRVREHLRRVYGEPE
jgi:hypothetical protein